MAEQIKVKCPISKEPMTWCRNCASFMNRPEKKAEKGLIKHYLAIGCYMQVYPEVLHLVRTTDANGIEIVGAK